MMFGSGLGLIDNSLMRPMRPRGLSSPGFRGPDSLTIESRLSKQMKKKKKIKPPGLEMIEAFGAKTYKTGSVTPMQIRMPYDNAFSIHSPRIPTA